MKPLTDKDLEKIYCGWLGKCIGIRYGAPVEMWDSADVVKAYGGKDGYFADYENFAADDDSNGPIFFFRALTDCADMKQFGSADVAKCWLNYVPYEHGFYWWGGYGVSAEHTAYLNLQKGILPPASGSILQNGGVLAQQIGGQIFSDVWGLVSPYDHHRAARLAEAAARVSHDGAAVDGGRFIAALISAAFGAKSVREAVGLALETLPQEGLYAKTVKDVLRLYEEGASAEACFSHIRTHYWKDKYGGNCHVIPNAAIVVFALLYGGGDFVRTLKIAVYSGFDTDCNAGNLGAVMGVFTLCSSLIGYENIVNIPTFACEIFRTALALRGERYGGKYAAMLTPAEGLDLMFLLPGSVSGLRAEGAKIQNLGGALHIRPSSGEACVYYQTYYGKEDFSDNRYDPAFSPKAYRGQEIAADYTAEAGCKVRLFWEDVHGRRIYASQAGARSLAIGGDEDALVGKIGLLVSGGAVTLKRLQCGGKADYVLDFAHEKMEDYALGHREVRQCTYYRGVWELENGELTGRCLEDGQLFTGKPLGDFLFETAMMPLLGSDYGLILRAEGAARQTRLVFDGKTVRLIRREYGDTQVAEAPCVHAAGGKVHIKLCARGDSLTVEVNGGTVLDVAHAQMHPRGIVGALAGNGSVVRFDRFMIKEI